MGTNVDLKEAKLTPVGAPRVPADPILLASLSINSISNHSNFVVKLWVSNVLLVDSSLVSLLEVIGGLDST